MRKTGSILAVGFLLAVMPFAGKGTAAAQDDALPPILDEQGNPAPGSVVALQKINLGGVGQWILIRGRDETKPVLLVLHGGPGETMMPWVDLFQRRELEENFVVVHWDQRNAGKSYSSALSGEDLDVEAYVDDTLELADLLTRRFRQDRIFLAGVSWGSALGFLTLERNSSLFRAFIATSEYVDWQRSQTAGFQWAKAEAESRDDREALEDIASIEPFDPTDLGDIAAKSRLLNRYRGGDFHTDGRWQGYLDYAASGQSPYYSTTEVKNYENSIEASKRAVLPQLAGYNLFEDYPVSDIPIHFVSGAEDHETPVELVEEYAAELKAPDKSLTIIQNTGHNVPFDAPKAWADTLIRIGNEVMAREN
ncbi:MAG: hypothetical protein CL535_01180 [Ahrensia sp.]|nr:hypothetical protein [Ahrensia sp.]|tara:strand:- start:16137 stop:17231 length:1095 start_codon:yes stop_codon:yes gene_type:complete